MLDCIRRIGPVRRVSKICILKRLETFIFVLKIPFFAAFSKNLETLAVENWEEILPIEKNIRRGDEHFA